MKCSTEHKAEVAEEEEEELSPWRSADFDDGASPALASCDPFAGTVGSESSKERANVHMVP